MDDAGMCQEANQAVMEYIENGHLQSAAVMMPCVTARPMVEWAVANPAADIGVHLTLTSEWKTYRWGSVAPSAEVPGLLDPDGKMWRNVPDVVLHATAQEVETEIRAQIDSMIAIGHRQPISTPIWEPCTAHPLLQKPSLKLPQNIISQPMQSTCLIPG